MEKENSKIAIKYSLKDVRELEFRYSNPFHNTKGFNPDHYVYEYGLQINYRWNMEKEIFGIVLDFLYKGKDNKEELELLKYTTLTEFKVEQLDQIFKPRGKNDFEIEEKWEKSFVSLAISTGRGMLIARTSGTFFQKHVFPLVDPSTVILSKKISKSNP